MKKGILLLLLLSSVFVHAQSLKDALFSGKLKNQPGTVIRKGDDLSTKIDTTQKIATDSGMVKTNISAVDSSAKVSGSRSDASAVSSLNNNNLAGTTDTATSAEDATALKEEVAAPKSNNELWKGYVDSVSSTLKTEVLPSKKVKRGTYYATVSYTIETDGQVSIGDVFLSPENAFLQQQIKERLSLDAPRLSPVLSSSGTARKINRRYNFTLTKE